MIFARRFSYSLELSSTTVLMITRPFRGLEPGKGSMRQKLNRGYGLQLGKAPGPQFYGKWDQPPPFVPLLNHPTKSLPPLSRLLLDIQTTIPEIEIAHRPTTRCRSPSHIRSLLLPSPPSLPPAWSSLPFPSSAPLLSSPSKH